MDHFKNMGKHQALIDSLSNMAESAEIMSKQQELSVKALHDMARENKDNPEAAKALTEMSQIAQRMISESKKGDPEKITNMYKNLVDKYAKGADPRTDKNPFKDKD